MIIMHTYCTVHVHVNYHPTQLHGALVWIRKDLVEVLKLHKVPHLLVLVTLHCKHETIRMCTCVRMHSGWIDYTHTLTHCVPITMLKVSGVGREPSVAVNCNTTHTLRWQEANTYNSYRLHMFVCTCIFLHDACQNHAQYQLQVCRTHPECTLTETLPLFPQRIHPSTHQLWKGLPAVPDWGKHSNYRLFKDAHTDSAEF